VWFRRKRIHGGGIQRLGYDLTTIRFDEESGAWTRFRHKIGAGGAKNADWLVYGQPVYAIADAEITNCWRNAPENPPNGKHHPGVAARKIPKSGNSVMTTLSTGDRVLYAHFMPGTIPEYLCPIEAEFMDLPNGLNTVLPEEQRSPIHRGQFLGRVGNSGQSSGPHLHVHIQDSSNTKPVGIPFEFLRVYGLKDNPTVPARWTVFTRAELPPGRIAIDPTTPPGR